MSTWQNKAEELARREMRNCWQLWGGSLSGNCLPVSLAVINYVREKHPNAYVEVGDLLKGSESVLSDESISNIANFENNQNLEFKPSFHAWINLGNGDIFDLVGPAWLRFSEPYFSKNDAENKDYYYHSVISDPIGVENFYERLKEGQLNNWRNPVKNEQMKTSSSRWGYSFFQKVKSIIYFRK